MTRTVLWLLATTLATGAAVPQGSVGTLAGRVVRAGTSEGIPDALVTFVPAGGTDLGVRTDSQGRFVFENVAAGTGRLNVRRDGYFSQTTALACLPTAPPPPPLPADGPLLNTASQCVAVIANQRSESEVPLIPGGTIRGLVLDIDGKPAVNTQVSASPVDGQGAAQTVQTNDRGEFRIFWVHPGKYTVGALPRSAFQQSSPQSPAATYFPVGDGVIEGLEVVLDEAGTVTGTLRNAEQQPASRTVILWMPDRSRRQDLSLFKTAVTNAAGRFFVNRILPGDYILSVWDGPVSSRMFANADFLDRVEGLGVRIHVNAGSTLDFQSALRRRSPDFRIPQGRTQPEISMLEIVPVDPSQASIEGRAWNGQNRAAGSAVVLVPDASRRGNAADYKTAVTSATGYFVFRGDLSGEYTVLAFESLPPEAPQSPEFLSKYATLGRVVSFSSAGSVSIQVNTIPR